MAINKELWLPAIEDNFYANWAALQRIAKDDSVYVVKDGHYAKVHIPNAGAAGAVLVNNTSYPATVGSRTDVTVEYTMDSYQVPPVRVGKFDAEKLSFDKIASVAKDFMGGIGERVMYQMFINWYIGKETGKFVETSGANIDGEAPGATGTRKAITTTDVKNAAKLLDKQNIPSTGRILLLPASMFYQLHDSVVEKFDIVDNDGLAMFDKPFLGFEVVKMPQVVNATTVGVARAYGNAGATTDIEVGLAYYKEAVSVAKTDTHIFTGEDRPEYYGDVLSAEGVAGGKYRRTDLKGVIPILQAQGA